MVWFPLHFLSILSWCIGMVPAVAASGFITMVFKVTCMFAGIINLLVNSLFTGFLCFEYGAWMPVFRSQPNNTHSVHSAAPCH